MTIINKTSIRVPSQLPEFIRDDFNYETFVAFVEAYYEWMESVNTSNSAITTANTTNQGVIYAAQNLLDYNDIDKTLDGFLDYYIRDFLPNFPENALVDKDKLIKIARQIYETKGTPASYKLLFRLLYNSDADLLYTRDLVFRASSGQWYIPKILNIRTSDNQWLSSNTQGLKVFGLTSKSFASIENVISTNKPEKYSIFVADIERLFKSGEYIKIVDSGNQDVYFKDGVIVSANTTGANTLNARLIGSVSSININPKFRGLKYRVNDPVVVYGGTEGPASVRASAFVAETTKGSIQSLNIITGGQGYRVEPNTKIVFTGGGGGSGAIATVQTVNTSATAANVTFLGSDIIALQSHIRLDALKYNFTANTNANSNCAISNALSFLAFSTYPIDSVIVQNGGGGYSSVPTATAQSYYQDALPGTTVWIKDGVIYTTNVAGSTEFSSNTHLLESIGILGPIQISTRGLGYQANDKIVFSGGSGSGAYANVTSVDGDGKILEVSYVQNYMDNNLYPLGGTGYTNQSLPQLTIESSNVSAYGANVYVNGILGTGAEFNLQTDRIGSITRIEMSEQGEDYTSTPNVSFRVADLVITNINGDLGSVIADTVLFQGQIDSPSWIAYVDSIEPLISTGDPLTDIYRIRVYNYSGTLNVTGTLYADIGFEPYPSFTLSTAFDGSLTDEYAIRNGVKYYGNGTAKGLARFLEGLVYGVGRYLTTVGHPSSYSVLQSDIHNDYTYILSVEKPISEYRDLLRKLIHPAGARFIGRNLLKNQKSFSFGGYPGLGIINPIQYWLGWPVGDATASVSVSSTNELVNTNIRIVSSGNGYNSMTTTVTVSPPNLLGGVQATAVANVVNGRITGVSFTNIGSGYTQPYITISDPTTRAGNANAYVVAWPKMHTNTVVVSTEVGSGMFDYLSNSDFIYINTNGYSVMSKINTLDAANSTITLDDEIWVTFQNVAYAYTDLTLNKLVVSEISRTNTPVYDIINSKKYSNTNNHIEDIVFAGDHITISGNTYVVKSIDYGNNTISIVNEYGILATNPDGSPVYTEDDANNIVVGEYIINVGTITNPVPFTINRTINTSNVFIRKSE